MTHRPKMIGIRHDPAFRRDPTLTGEEAIVLRALAGGNTDRQVCNRLHMHPNTYLRMMRDMREKIHMVDNVSLIEWAKERIKGLDQRIDQTNGRARLA